MELPDLLTGSTVVAQATLCTRKDQWAQGVRQAKDVWVLHWSIAKPVLDVVMCVLVVRH